MLEDGLVGAGFHLILMESTINAFDSLVVPVRLTKVNWLPFSSLYVLSTPSTYRLSGKLSSISDCQAGIQASLKPARDNFLGTSIFDELQTSPGITNIVWTPLT